MEVVGLVWISPMDATPTPIDSTNLWIYEWICVDIGIPYMVLHGGAIGHAMEGGL